MASTTWPLGGHELHPAAPKILAAKVLQQALRDLISDVSPTSDARAWVGGCDARVSFSWCAAVLGVSEERLRQRVLRLARLAQGATPAQMSKLGFVIPRGFAKRRRAA